MAKDALGHGSDTKGGSNEFDKGPLVPGYTSRGAQLLQATMRNNPNPPIVGVPAHQTGIDKATAPMQRRQFEAIAGAINETNVPGAVKGALAQHFANALRGSNPNFNADKFRTAATTGNMGRTKNAPASMTRAHYEAVASAVHNFGAAHPEAKGLAESFANSLGRRNPNFNASKFISKAK
jgi:hypothetical protein